MERLLWIAVAVASTWPRAAAGETALTLERALSLARERAPAILAARARVQEARGRLTGAAVWLRENPLVEGAAGRRSSERGESADIDVGVSQTFELGGRRGARVAAAEAGVAGAMAGVEETLRRLLRDVSGAFFRALHAEERVRLAAAAGAVAAEVAHVAERRHAAGDVPVLDVNVARSALARARSGARDAEAAREATLGDLKILLGIGAAEQVAVRGDLRDRSRLALPDRLASPSERPDLRALGALRREAEAEVRLGEGQRWPDLGLGAGYQREEEADVILGGLSFTLPVFERGLGLRQEARARTRRLGLELQAASRAVEVEAHTALEVYRRRVEAIEVLERDALPLLGENESLARKSYEAGQIGLAELLLIRRETLETRNEYLNRLLEAALAGVELQAAVGVLR